MSNGLEFIYDHTGLCGLRYNDTEYFYRKDAQGNIAALLDKTGAVVVYYEYDAWGNHAVLGADRKKMTDVNHIGNLNPFRYRGYYYDTETGLYYLKTRYYDPETGRFISQDGVEYADPESINGLNLYAYCGNNPVMNVDPTGTNFADDISTMIDNIMFIFKIGIYSMKGLFKSAGSLPYLKSFVNGAVGVLEKAGAVIGIASYVLIGVSDIINGLRQGKSALNIATDIVFDCTVIAACGLIGSMIGSVIPVVGTAIGAAIGTVLGILYMVFYDNEVIKGFRDGLYNGVQNLINDFGALLTTVNDFLTDTWHKFVKWVRRGR